MTVSNRSIIDRVTRDNSGELIPRERMQRWEPSKDIGASRPSPDILAQNLYVACIEDAFEYLCQHYDGKRAQVSGYHRQILEHDAEAIQQEYELRRDMIVRANVMDIYTRFETYLACWEVEYLQSAQLTRTRPLPGPSTSQDFYDDAISAMQILFDCPARRILYAKFWATKDFLELYPRVAKLYRNFDATVRREKKAKTVAIRKAAWHALQEADLIEKSASSKGMSPENVTDESIVSREQVCYLDFRHWGIIAAVTIPLLLIAWITLPLPTACPVVMTGLLFLVYAYRKIATIQSRVDAYLGRNA